jgi:AAA15 family ATPase/GTPase
MELKEIQIENFRSIKNEKIAFTHDCLVLLGKNEAGKTNILKAIAAVFGQYKVKDKDKRKRIDNEKITDFYIRAVFNLTSEDFNTIEQKFNIKYNGVENITFKNGMSFKEFIIKTFYNMNIKILIAEGSNPEKIFWTYNKKDIELEKPLFIAANNITLIPGTPFNLVSKTFEIVKTIYEQKPVKCHYWQYSDSYLLPNNVDIEDFTNNPEKYKALENIFALCGREDISKEFENAIAEDGDYSNLLEQVSKKVTITFQKIWKDFKGTSIQLLPNGDEILIKIVEKAKYNFEDRSDGFKKFISILLMLSTECRTNKILKNDIILIDEPDKSLYPTSAKYLKDELIEISKKSKVIYSTHSQYMIDSSVIDRHLIIEKIDDITVIKKENINAPFSKDELLRRAIGSSIFECLKPKNIIFEGYLDKELFQLYCKLTKNEKKFSEFGIVYLGGISGAETLTQILILANKNFVIIADSDDVSNSKKTDFIKNYPEYKNNWISYSDSSQNIHTMEDFFTIQHIEKQFKNLEYQHIYDSLKNANLNIEKAVKGDKNLKQEFKKQLVLTAKKEHIIPQYQEYIEIVERVLASL